MHSYLRDFLFSDERARSPVKALSGGERNRLLLARLFTRPANVLVLDEPTNDLDLETLELLEAQLVEWPGTLLLVSHDRVFLDHVVSSTLAFEGDGRIAEYVGGYEDWLRQRPVEGRDRARTRDRPGRAATPAAGSSRLEPEGTREPAVRKLTYKEQRELSELPARIETLEAEQARLHAAANGPAFYREPPDVIAGTLARMHAVDKELLAALARWDDLDSRQREGRRRLGARRCSSAWVLDGARSRCRCVSAGAPALSAKHRARRVQMSRSCEPGVGSICTWLHPCATRALRFSSAHPSASSSVSNTRVRTTEPLCAMSTSMPCGASRTAQATSLPSRCRIQSVVGRSRTA